MMSAIIFSSKISQYPSQLWRMNSTSRPVWVNRGFSFAGRIRHLEERWMYYLAFGGHDISSAESSSHFKIQPGLPSALICTLGTGLASFALFAFVFPLVWLMNPITANNLHNPNSTLSLPHMQDLRLSTLSIPQARQTMTLFVIHRLSFLFVYGYSLQWSFSMTW